MVDFASLIHPTLSKPSRSQPRSSEVSGHGP